MTIKLSEKAVEEIVTREVAEERLKIANHAMDLAEDLRGPAATQMWQFANWVKDGAIRARGEQDDDQT